MSSVRISDSTASTPRQQPLEGIPQNQYFYVVYKDQNDKRYKVLNIEGRMATDPSLDSKAIDWAIENSVDKGPILFMAGEYSAKPKTLNNVSIAGSGPNRTRIVIDVDLEATSLNISDMTIEGSVHITNGLIERCAFPRMQARFTGCDVKQVLARRIASNDSVLINCQADEILSKGGDKISYSTLKELYLGQSAQHIIQSNKIDSLVSFRSDGIITHNTIGRFDIKETKGVVTSNTITDYPEFCRLDELSTCVFRDNYGIPSETYGLAVFSGDGICKNFSINHRISIRRPTFVFVGPGSTGAVRRDYFYEYDQDKILVRFLEPPLAGINNIQLHYLARI